MSDPKNLAEAVKARRSEFGLKQAELATRSGLSLDRIQAVEAARHESYREATLARIDAALGWEPGSAASALSGGTVVASPLSGEPPQLYRVTVVTTSQQSTETFQILDPAWVISATDSLQLFDGERPVAAFAPGYWRSVRAEELDR